MSFFEPFHDCDTIVLVTYSPDDFSSMSQETKCEYFRTIGNAMLSDYSEELEELFVGIWNELSVDDRVLFLKTVVTNDTYTCRR